MLYANDMEAIMKKIQDKQDVQYKKDPGNWDDYWLDVMNHGLDRLKVPATDDELLLNDQIDEQEFLKRVTKD